MPLCRARSACWRKRPAFSRWAGASATRKATRATSPPRQDSPFIAAIPSSMASGVSPPPPADCRFSLARKPSRSVKSTARVTYSSPRSRYSTSPKRSSTLPELAPHRVGDALDLPLQVLQLVAHAAGGVEDEGEIHRPGLVGHRPGQLDIPLAARAGRRDAHRLHLGLLRRRLHRHAELIHPREAIQPGHEEDAAVGGGGGCEAGIAVARHADARARHRAALLIAHGDDGAVRHHQVRIAVLGAEEANPRTRGRRGS